MPAADTINIGWFTLPVPIPENTRLGWHPVPEGVPDHSYARVGWYKLGSAFFGPPGPPVIRSPLTAGGMVDTPFTYQIAASGRPTSFDAPGLPAGLSIDHATGRITGTPTSQGATSVTISATNAEGTGTATLVITIAAAGAAPTITSPASVSGTINQPFSHQITASGNPTYYDAVGLPPGLSINHTSGVISGTPTALGNTNVTVTAENANGTSAPQTLAITIAAAASPAHYGSTTHWMQAPPPTPAELTPAYLKGLASTVANPASGTVMACSVPAGTHGFVFAYPLALPAASQIIQQGLGFDVLPGTMQVTVNIDGVDYRVYYMEDQEFPHGSAETYTLTIG